MKHILFILFLSGCALSAQAQRVEHGLVGFAATPGYGLEGTIGGGLGYWEKLEDATRNAQGKRNLDEIIGKYRDKNLYSAKTDLMERFELVGDFEMQVILRNLDNETLAAALNGASGKIVTRFLRNLSDRLLYFVSEDIDNWSGTEEDILKAQRQVLAVGGCFLAE